MNYVRFILVSSLACLLGSTAQAQFRGNRKQLPQYTFSTTVSHENQSWLSSQAKDFQKPPVLSGLAAVPFNQRSAYWLSQVTTQSMNEGKMGTYYLWDQQGNLRESRFFMDIGGRKIPGLKLVFPRR